MAIVYIHKELICGSITGHIKDRCGFISSLYVKEEYRNKGFGTMLLSMFLHEIYNNNVLHIELYDCSDNYRKTNNIYLKYGFKYIDIEHRMSSNVRNSLLLLQKNGKIIL